VSLNSQSEDEQKFSRLLEVSRKGIVRNRRLTPITEKNETTIEETLTPSPKHANIADQLSSMSDIEPIDSNSETLLAKEPSSELPAMRIDKLDSDSSSSFKRIKSHMSLIRKRKSDQSLNSSRLSSMRAKLRKPKLSCETLGRFKCSRKKKEDETKKLKVLMYMIIHDLKYPTESIFQTVEKSID
jgi:hypothetical protein